MRFAHALTIVAVLVGGNVTLADYAPEPWNIAARKRFAAQRFGIFIHWGLYANYAQGEWYQQQIGVDTETYGRMMYGFYPSRFNARQWVRAFKEAGAKYVTITSRHHDGFSLWPTRVDDGYNIASTPFKRDILGELAEACRQEGLQLNFYYSLMDWHRKDYPAGTHAMKVLGPQRGDYASYKRFMMAQIAELIDSYHPGTIWFDGEWEHCRKAADMSRLRHEEDPSLLDWEFDDIYDLIHSKQVLVANNNHAKIREKEDIQLFERDLPGENATGYSVGQTVVQDRPIEQCDVIQTAVWGYRIEGRDFRSPEDICTLLVKAAAKDSNLLMNIGPNGAGELPDRALVALKGVGEWMRANSHAIYGTHGGGFSRDGKVAYTKCGDKTYAFDLPNGNTAFPVLRVQ